jgi:ubiquinone/menaquinone biosynthesis C-methylase UbiE
MHKGPHGAGSSTYDLIDSGKLFSRLNLQKGAVFLDLGCGKGNYSLPASEYVGGSGLVYAVDLWKEGIEQLEKAVAEKGLKNVRVMLTDASKKLPIEDDSVDMCFMATVFHDLVYDHNHDGALAEVKRVLKQSGTLALVEFKKMEGPPGPPIEIRLSPEELDAMLGRYGFAGVETTELGTYHYLSTYRVRSGA